MTEPFIAKRCAHCGSPIFRQASARNWNLCLGCEATRRIGEDTHRPPLDLSFPDEPDDDSRYRFFPSLRRRL